MSRQPISSFYPAIGYQYMYDTWSLAKFVRKVEFKQLQFRANVD
ncbi:MAG: hypothetical protein WCF61_19635 [Terriglobales bacterium]